MVREKGKEGKKKQKKSGMFWSVRVGKKGKERKKKKEKKNNEKGTCVKEKKKKKKGEIKIEKYNHSIFTINLKW